jgi:hypothetical protein
MQGVDDQGPSLAVCLGVELADQPVMVEHRQREAPFSPSTVTGTPASPTEREKRSGVAYAGDDVPPEAVVCLELGPDSGTPAVAGLLGDM